MPENEPTGDENEPTTGYENQAESYDYPDSDEKVQHYSNIRGTRQDTNLKDAVNNYNSSGGRRVSPFIGCTRVLDDAIEAMESTATMADDGEEVRVGDANEMDKNRSERDRVKDTEEQIIQQMKPCATDESADGKPADPGASDNQSQEPATDNSGSQGEPADKPQGEPATDKPRYKDMGEMPEMPVLGVLADASSQLDQRESDLKEQERSFYRAVACGEPATRGPIQEAEVEAEAEAEAGAETDTTPADKPTDKPTDKPDDTPADTPAPADKPADKPAAEN
jgi:hypothetical protein